MKDKLFGGAPPSGRAAKAKSGSNGPGLVARVGHASADVSSLLISRVRVKPVQSLLQLIHLLKAIPFPRPVSFNQDHGTSCSNDRSDTLFLSPLQDQEANL